MKHLKKTYLFVIAIASAATILCFQDCAKDPNLANYTNSSASTSTLGTTTTPGSVQAPSITSTPANITVTAGQPINVVVSAIGTTLVYQWQKNGADIANQTNTLAIASSLTTDAGTYSIIVSNSAGSVTAIFTVTVTAQVTVTKPVIVTAPVALTGRDNLNTDVFTVVGDATAPFDLATFTVVASGTNLTYQWYHIVGTTTTLITGATKPSYSFTFDSDLQGGTYLVDVTNSAGTTQSSAVFTVIDAMPGGGGNK